MDPVFLAVNVFAGLTLFLLSLFLYYKLRPSDAKVQPAPQNDQAPIRRVQGGRNQRERMRQNNARRLAAENVAPDDAAQDEDNGSDSDQAENADLDKMGAKKRAKLEAKAERKAQREKEEQLRDEKKKREQKREEERRIAQEKEELEEKQREEALKKEIEERERREHEEYLKMKSAFEIEEEGYDENETDEANQLETFVNYIKDSKVVVLEDLAAHFKLKTQAVIDRIQDLQKSNVLTGVIDDRGKFIYISQKDLDSVAQFIRQRGRVSITELAENSNKLISLEPVKS